MDVTRLLRERVLVMDGAMGTMLQESGLRPGENPALLNLRSPDAVMQVHLAYLEAGADMILTNTFGANGRKLPDGCEVGAVVERAVGIAREAAARHASNTGVEALVALDIGPIGELLEPSGSLRFDQAYALFREQVTAGVAAGADAIYIETMADLLEAKCAVLAAKEHSGLPVFCTMSFEKGMRTYMGVDITAMALTLDGLGVDCIGLNCSLGPEEMMPVVRELMCWTNRPIAVKPNAGDLARMLELGVNAVGGCCGTTPDCIRRLRERAQNQKPREREAVGARAVCSATQVVHVDRVTVIGERINPAGKSALQKALLEQDMDFVADEATEQVDAGADILDVNVCAPKVDEPSAMADAVRAIQAVTRVPLAVDSLSAETIEAGLRAYNGKPILNSVTGSQESLRTMLPLAKKYGAVVIGLTMDEKGIPPTAEGRVRVAEKIRGTAAHYGIPPQDVWIDCLTLASCTQQELIGEALAATERVKGELGGVRTVLGISNVSYGMPARAKLNQAYLLLALERGLDLPILDPTAPGLMDAVYCFRQLKNMDENSGAYLRRFGKS